MRSDQKQQPPGVQVDYAGSVVLVSGINRRQWLSKYKRRLPDIVA